jgi:phosphohistidine phosphatase
VAGRTLLLMRHAKSAWPDVPDRDRPLASRGRRDAPVMGRWLRAVGYIPDRVICSTALRARQTWQLARPALEADPEVIFEDHVYEASASHLLELVRRTSADVRTLLVVGHDPAVPDLARTLAAAAAETGTHPAHAAGPTAAERMRPKFPTAAIAAFSFDPDWDQFGPEDVGLACYLTPRELRA